MLLLARRLCTGKPVQSKLVESVETCETEIFPPFRVAPLPSAAAKSSFEIGLYTTPAKTEPFCANAMETEKHGYLWAKFVVPSSGSTCQRNSALRWWPNPSSAEIVCSGKYLESFATIARSLRLSACVTKSTSPL